MRTFKHSLVVVTLLALGALSCANAETTSVSALAQNDTESKAIPPSTKTSLLEALQGTTIGGYAYGQLTSMFGDDASGTAFRVRTFANVNTGAYHGFSIGTSLMATIGGGAPDGGTFLGNSGKSPKESLGFLINTFYGRQTFDSTATVITAGKINIITPFSDGTWDFGYGASIDNYDIQGLGFHAQAYAAWALDNTNEIPSSVDFTSEKGLFILGVSGSAQEFSGVGFEAWVAHALDTIDFLTFAELNYTIVGMTLEGQVAATQVNTASKHFASPETAKLRGLYNLQVGYSAYGTSLALGYTGSFGDGYGALLNNVSSFNMGGKIWYDTVGSAANGYGIGGVGGYKSNGSSPTIQVAYLSLGYKGVKNLTTSLDYAFIGGNNNYMLMKHGVTNHQGKKNINAIMHEVSVSVNYTFTEKLSLSALVGSTFGDLQMGRARAKLTYSF